MFQHSDFQVFHVCLQFLTHRKKEGERVLVLTLLNLEAQACREALPFTSCLQTHLSTKSPAVTKQPKRPMVSRPSSSAVSKGWQISLTNSTTRVLHRAYHVTFSNDRSAFPSFSFLFRLQGLGLHALHLKANQSAHLTSRLTERPPESGQFLCRMFPPCAESQFPNQLHSAPS